MLSEDDSSYSLPEYSAIEVQYQTSSKLRHTQVRQHLSHVYPVEAFYALDLDYHASTTKSGRCSEISVPL